MLMKVPKGRGGHQEAAETVLERKESAPVLSILLCCLSAHSLSCTPNRGQGMSSNTLTTVVRYTNVDYQIITVTVSNMVEHVRDSVLMSRVTCTQQHMNTNCTEILSE